MIQKNIFYIFGVGIIVLVISGGVFAFQIIKDKKEKPAVTNEVAVKNDPAPAQIAPKTAEAPSLNINTNQSQIPPKEAPRAALVPPMDNFNGRVTLNAFGNQPSRMRLDEAQYTDLVCASGKHYPGFHTAVDLEVTLEERNKPVSVYSIADGTVRQAWFVNGYGGLMVIEYNINGQAYTAYYGHMDVSTFTVKSGDRVKAGQKLALLASACTDANGHTRKHLHFGLHKGKDVVVAGYVDTKKELDNWIDPREIIK